ncbi:ImmA/IrrE family metallo-endopeptidase [Rhizorhapis suberifaciens]|uniref:IrrE N-terminal-like domain-containing protein n=1 Tax=Rhizorhapis suberifaciens TaxID=13656 RepID=A0A840HX59_9SPHN|nr:ImmA/IrrE family metallo-endopeptidase [Rhizorhapis suberifaciens]MBB4642952.1 hypothetical protein [Rhizorhapis suberifaciens]
MSKLWGARFPVEVKTIALEYTQQRFADPIKKIAEASVDHFEGALAPLPKSGKWAILYNPNIASAGRINFTLAHELGHYFAHRHLNPGGFECGEKQVLGVDRDAERRRIEQEADAFASYLLMPMDDYRAQVGRDEMTLGLLRQCADRYDVSMTAAAIKWLDLTPKCAALVVATNGFVLWCWRSPLAKKRGIYFPSGMELPAGSLAAQPGLILSEVERGIMLDRSVWGGGSDVREMAIFADRYEMTISLLVFDGEAYGYAPWDLDGEAEEDTFDRFNKSL